jgi:surface antigen
MRKFLVAFVIVSFGWVVITVTGTAQEKAKYTTKEVMQKAHKGGLMKKVAEGKASADEKKQLLEFYEALAANKPPKGDEAEWKVKTSAIVAAARAAAEGDATAGEKLQATVKCMECHQAHKGK